VVGVGHRGNGVRSLVEETLAIEPAHGQRFGVVLLADRTQFAVERGRLGI
jgi:hypothetical protein